MINRIGGELRAQGSLDRPLQILGMKAPWRSTCTLFPHHFAQPEADHLQLALPGKLAANDLPQIGSQRWGVRGGNRPPSLGDLHVFGIPVHQAERAQIDQPRYLRFTSGAEEIEGPARQPIQLQGGVLFGIYPAEMDDGIHSLGQQHCRGTVVQVTGDKGVGCLLKIIIRQDYLVVPAEGVGKVLRQTMRADSKQ